MRTCPIRVIFQKQAVLFGGRFAVDSQDNLYVENTVNSSVTVFGPTDTGTVVPSRTIAGKLSGPGTHFNFGMATDSSGNLYVLCVCAQGDGNGGNAFIAYEFGPQANGDDPPIRSVTSLSMYPWSGGPGLAVDSDGVLFITAGPPIGGTQTVFEFSSGASGSAAPINIVTSLAVWTDTLVSHVAVH
jgi:hypothetical protein